MHGPNRPVVAVIGPPPVPAEPRRGVLRRRPHDDHSARHIHRLPEPRARVRRVARCQRRRQLRPLEHVDRPRRTVAVRRRRPRAHHRQRDRIRRRAAVVVKARLDRVGRADQGAAAAHLLVGDPPRAAPAVFKIEIAGDLQARLADHHFGDRVAAEADPGADRVRGAGRDDMVGVVFQDRGDLEVRGNLGACGGGGGKSGDRQGQERDERHHSGKSAAMRRQ